MFIAVHVETLSAKGHAFHFETESLFFSKFTLQANLST